MGKMLITGATGFIGCRLAEVAVRQGRSVVGLVRTWSAAPRLARLPVQMIAGDMLAPQSLQTAMKDCDTVIHCAADNRAEGKARRRALAEGTANVMHAARGAGVKRLIHLSSVAVFGHDPRADAATEAGRVRYTGDPYVDGKIDAERAALAAFTKYGLPVVVLRPTIVYGPFGYWTTSTVRAIRDGRIVLVNGGTGICNTLHIDNLVSAILLAAEREEAVGQVFHISDAQPCTWKEFIEAHARALGDEYLPIASLKVGEIAALRKLQRKSSVKEVLRLLQNPNARRALRKIPVVDLLARAARTTAGAVLPRAMRGSLRQKLIPADNSGSLNGKKPPAQPISLPSKDEVEICSSSVVFSIAKARRGLGYLPEIAFAAGMDQTADWIKWARL
jgi:nucleoside-diphosphate-sugar epimerase